MRSHDGQRDLTHRGWQMLCPVYLADIDTDAPYTEPRKWIPDWWYEANVALECGLIHLASLIGIEPAFGFLVTGELK